MQLLVRLVHAVKLDAAAAVLDREAVPAEIAGEGYRPH